MLGLTKILSSPKSYQQKSRTAMYQAMLRREAHLGGQLFGPVPRDIRREFFCLDKNTWVWHEEWTDQDGVRRHKTTRYDVRPSGVLKTQDGQNGYQKLSENESQNLLAAINLYKTQVVDRLYSQQDAAK